VLKPIEKTPPLPVPAVLVPPWIHAEARLGGKQKQGLGQIALNAGEFPVPKLTAPLPPLGALETVSDQIETNTGSRIIDWRIRGAAGLF
jgi:hypothetical protein